MKLTIGIDATNLRSGGGVTHLVELLRAAHPSRLGVDRVVVWGGTQILAALEDRPWLEKRNPPELEHGLPLRVFWQRHRLSKAAYREECDVLFVPGGSYVGHFHPVVTMSQSLLPFTVAELRRYGCTLFTLKLLLLRWTQSRSFRRAEGVVFLTEYACDAVLNITGKLKGKARVIPHGVNPRFNHAPRVPCSLNEFSQSHPFRVLYVSTIDLYKHQWHVVEAIAALRGKGLHVVLDLVGPAYSPALNRLNATIDRLDARREWVKYHEILPYETLHEVYAAADVGVCASTCEAFGLMLLESMAAGLPIACSGQRPMQDLVGKAGIYFDPERPDDIARVLYELMASQELRKKLAQKSRSRARQYSWEICADKTFAFLVETARRKKELADVCE